MNETSFAVSEYCLEVSEERINDSESSWNVMVCDDGDEWLYVKLHLISALRELRNLMKFLKKFFLVLSITLGLLLLTLIFYGFVNELRNCVHGKCIIGFVLALIIADGFSRISILYPFMLAFSSIGLILAFLWTNVMVFDVYWKLK